MRINDRSPTGRRLQTIFLPAEPRPVMPTEISDEIVLVHPAVPPMVGLKEGKFFFSATQGAVGVTEVVGPLVPTDRYWWVQLCDFFHDDPVDRSIVLQMRDTVPNTVAIVADPALKSAFQLSTLPRPFLLPNDTQFVASAAVAAAQRISLRFFFLEFFHAEINPSA